MALAVTLAEALVLVARVAEVAVPCLAGMVAVLAVEVTAVLLALEVALPRTTCASL